MTVSNLQFPTCFAHEYFLCFSRQVWLAALVADVASSPRDLSDCATHRLWPTDFGIKWVTG